MAGKMQEPTAKQSRLLNECAVLLVVASSHEAEYERAYENFRSAILKARKAKCSIGQIAYATGLTRSHVQQLLKP